MELNNGKINAHQFKVLALLIYIGTSVLLIPGLLATEAKQDAWIAAIFGVIGSLILAWFYTIVGEQIGNMTLVEYTKKLFGRWIGGLVSLTFVSFLFFNSTTLVWVVGNFITTQLMPETPMIVINAIYMIVVVIGSRLGVEIIARSAEILFPWVVGGLIFLLLFSLPEAQIKHLQPVFESGIKPLIQGGLFFQGFISLTLVVLLMIYPSNINNIQEGKKAFLKGALTAGILITILTLVCMLVLGAESTARNIYPSYALAKKISIGDFIERIEAVLGMVWIITVFFKTILYFHSAVVGFSQALELKDYKPFTLPLGILTVILSKIVYPDVVYASNWDTTTWISYAFTYGFIFPLILFLIGKLKYK